jgi:alpha-beta hydrolase superfamily lysophospholipase
MPRFFKDEGFEFATELALGATYYRAADVGEVLATVGAVKSGDYDSWCDAWLEAAERLAATAERCELQHHRQSAFEAWLRASNYFDKASFYMLGTKEPDRFVPTWRRHRDCFERAAALYDPPFEKVAIPYADGDLEGWLFRPRDAEGRLPLLILNNGSDGTVLDMWLQGGAAAVERGYLCLTFDGPGQGRALHEQGMHFRPDWEAVITPVVDHVLGRADVDPERIALQGVSQGGYWVPRAVAFEQRISAAIADPGVMDVSTAMTDHLPKSLRKHLDAGEKEKFNRSMSWGERFSKEARFTVDFRGRPYGAETPFDMFDDARAYRLEPDVIARIQCPMLITDPEGEQFWPGQSQQLYDALPGPKELVRFTVAEGADSHCEPKALGLRNQRVLDWLDGVMPGAGAASAG